jgi:hypothetical protein
MMLTIKKKVVTLFLALSLLFALAYGPSAAPDIVFAGDCSTEPSTSC